MAIVAGVDFGTQSVRVSIVDDGRGMLGSCACPYRVIRKKDNPDHASQRHEDHMDSLEHAFKGALAESGAVGADVRALALATTGSTIVPLGADMRPLDEYYLWCDHRAAKEAAEITETARRIGWKGIDWAGGAYSAEMGLAKILHWLRNNPGRQGEFAAVAEHGDMAVAVLCGIADPAAIPRGACGMGHKWLYNAAHGGLPPKEFLEAVDPLLGDIAAKLQGPCKASDNIAGFLCPEWAGRLGLKAGIPVPFAGIDAHWDAIAAGIAPGDIVNVIGTSACVMAITQECGPIPGVFSVARGSIHPAHMGIEAGLSAAGDLLEAIARRAGKTVPEMSRAVAHYKTGQSGMIRLAWDNGDRSILMKPRLRGITLGWTLQSTAEDEFHAAMEGLAFHTRIILEHISAHGVPITRVINGGGIPRKDDVLNQIYANILDKPVLVPAGSTTGLGAAAFAFIAAGLFRTIEEIQNVLRPDYRIFSPDPVCAETVKRAYAAFKSLYFSLGAADPLGVRLPTGK
jgi:L-ribulokinase